MVRVVPDVAGLAKTFDYLVPAALADEVQVGSLVRIDLHGRRVGAWVVALDVAPPDGVVLKELAHLTGVGPAADLVELSGWAAWRWAGRRRTFLRAASPPGRVRALPRPPSARPVAVTVPPGPEVVAALAQDRGVVRLPPGADRYPVVVAALGSLAPDRDALVLCPSVDQAQALTARLRRAGVAVACVAHRQPGAAATAEWARAAAGGVAVVGARAGAWAPVPRLGRVVVLDEHDEAYQEESAPTWHARDVVVERARRAGGPGAAGVALPDPRGAGVGGTSRCPGGPTSAGGGPRSTWSTAARRTRPQGCSPSRWPRCCAAVGGSCAW